MSDNDNRKLDRILTMQERIMGDVHQINRAIYGDPRNKVPGLIDRQIADEVEIKKLKDTKKKFLWTAAGVLLVLEIFRDQIINLFTK